MFQKTEHPGQCFTSKVAGSHPQLPGWFCPQLDKSPSSQQQLLAEALRQAFREETRKDTAIKLLGIAQVILSGGYVLLNESAALTLLQQLVAFSIAECSLEVKDQIATIAALLLNRIRAGIADQPDATIQLIDKALNASNSNRQKSLFSAMRARIVAAQQRFQSKKVRVFDVPPLDIATAAKNVRDDIEGDWYQDPWGWPEVEWLGSARPQIVVDRLRNGLCGWTVPMDVSKGGQGVRPGIIINPLDRVAFQSLADELSLEAAGELPPWVHGCRWCRVAFPDAVCHKKETD